jgi:hypothetical protein
MPAYGSGTIAAVNSKRSGVPAQDPIGATNNLSSYVNRIANGTIGSSEVAISQTPERLADGTPGYNTAEAGYTYEVAGGVGTWTPVN